MLKAKQLLQNRYQLQQCLSQNAGRQTWLAEDTTQTPPQQVIVKLLAFSPQMEWDEFKLFEREAQVLKTLNHPRIPKHRDYFSLDEQMGQGLCWFCLVQDYIPGQSLQQLLNQGKHFTLAQVRSIAIQILEILSYLHGLNLPVLHRDIKPSNLIFQEDVDAAQGASVYLVDFGAVADPTVVEGVTFTVVGTAGYAPLEQFWGKAVPASDLYALGATLIHLLTGTAPADLPQQNLRIHFRDRVSLSPSFVNWLESLTDPNLERRFNCASQATSTLNNLNRYYLYKNHRRIDRNKVLVKPSLTIFWSWIIKIYIVLGIAASLVIPFMMFFSTMIGFCMQECRAGEGVLMFLMIPFFIVTSVLTCKILAESSKKQVK
ncbi:MAG: serine/threonine-protein kinase [Coleofasciculus sp. D1-CHI-01]|uniref:serine/threonine protein kinase n=1 Tax=Coleofasciculus sp. D1-CHI-01 TaxID=3068482 RepID=UPI0032F4C157